ncbi:MAG: hypothetical protein ACREHF_05955 [Rhizomicrobium sp.]
MRPQFGTTLHVSLNPVRARLVLRAQDWLKGEDDGLASVAPVSVAPVLARIADLPQLLAARSDRGFALRRSIGAASAGSGQARTTGANPRFAMTGDPCFCEPSRQGSRQET